MTESKPKPSKKQLVIDIAKIYTTDAPLSVGFLVLFIGFLYIFSRLPDVTTLGEEIGVVGIAILMILSLAAWAILLSIGEVNRRVRRLEKKT